MLSCATLRSLLAEAGTVILPVAGQSMMPTLQPDDHVQVQPFPFEDLAPGDIIAFYQDGKHLVHRVKVRVGLGLLTCGDNNILLDPIVTKENYIGRVSAQIKPDGTRCQFFPEHTLSPFLKGSSPTLLLEKSAFQRVCNVKPKYLGIAPLTKDFWHEASTNTIGISPYGLHSEETLARWLNENRPTILVQASFGPPGSGLVPTTKIRGAVRLGIYDWWSLSDCPRVLVSYLDGFIGGVTTCIRRC